MKAGLPIVTFTITGLDWGANSRSSNSNRRYYHCRDASHTVILEWIATAVRPAVTIVMIALLDASPEGTTTEQ